MAYGDLSMDAPCKSNKGLEDGACNRQSCQSEPANWYNHGSGAWYCDDCAHDIGEDHVNRRDWDFNFRPRLGHSQFETREQMDSRRKRSCTIDGRIEQLTAPSFGWSRRPQKPQSHSLRRMLKSARRRV